MAQALADGDVTLKIFFKVRQVFYYRVIERNFSFPFYFFSQWESFLAGLEVPRSIGFVLVKWKLMSEKADLLS